MSMTSRGVPRLDGPGWSDRQGKLPARPANLARTPRQPPGAQLGTMRTTLDRAGRELYELWRSALAEGDADLADRLTVVSHALHRASSALDQEVVVPSRRDSATSSLSTFQPEDAAGEMSRPAPQPEPCLAEADVCSLDGAADEADPPR